MHKPQIKTKLTPEEALVELNDLPLDDFELAHKDADLILCKLLSFLGQDEIVIQYLSMQKDWKHA